MDFAVLGPLEVSRDGAPVRIGSRMQRRLLALLLVHAGAPVSTEKVIDVLWAGEPPPSAPKGLHAYVSRLRRALGDAVEVEADAHGYRLSLDGHELDAQRFETLVGAAREHLADEPAAAAARLAEALALWRGEAYGEFSHEEFARPEAVRLDELRATATEDAFAARLACGEDAELIGDLEAFVAAHPLGERPHAQLMTALARAGRQTEALGVFDRLRGRLASELGLEPSPSLQRLQADILRQAADVMPPDADVGLRPAEPHPAGPRPGEPGQPGNLPAPVTSLVGRERETETVCGLLERARLVTLTGVGGVGKTRLALRAAATAAERYPHGVWWCELAPVDADAVDHTVADVLGVQQQAERGVADSITGALAGKQLLLVLDNCEHVAAASAHLVRHVLRGCPRVTVLATSREPLAVEGEQVWQVPPLPLPTEHGGDEADSVLLFSDRAATHRADFGADAAAADGEAIADICRQLDGLPLAIELAAALVPALDPAEIARRLEQRFELLTHGPRTDPRHRSLGAVVAWSYGLLDEAEQRLFDRLAVFAGGFTLAAAEGVCADEHLPSGRVAALLAGLVNRSMVLVDRSAAPARYRLLETLRHYAAERLAERDEAPALGARHAAWFVDLAEQADAAVRGPGEAEAVALLEAELANLRAANRWAVAHDDADTALRLADALYVFAVWRLRDEVFDWAEQAAGLPAAAGHRLQPTVWGAVAVGISNRGELDRTRALAEHALAAAAESGEAKPFPALVALWSAAIYEGRLADHRAHAREALEVARRAGDAYGAVWAKVHGVMSLVYGDDRDAGREEAEIGLAAAEELGNPGQRAWARYVLAEAHGDDDPDRALELLADALALAAPVGDRFLEGVARVAMTSLLARHRSSQKALAAFPDLIRHWHRAGDWTHQWTTLRNLVPLLVGLEADEPAARLYGAQRAAHTGTYGADAARLAEACETLTARLGSARFDALVDEGAALGATGAVELSLATIADVGDRDEGAATP